MSPTPDNDDLQVCVLSYRGSQDAIRWGDVLVTQGAEEHRRRFLLDRISQVVILDSVARFDEPGPRPKLYGEDAEATPPADYWTAEQDHDPARVAAVRAALLALEPALVSLRA